MKSYFSGLILLTVLSVISFASNAEIIVSLNYASALKSKDYKITKMKIRQIAIEFGDTVRSLTIKTPGEYRVYQQTETSVSVMQEGSHIDLIDWKHGYSKSVELTEVNNKFTLVDHSNLTIFPKVTRTEIAKEAKRVGGKRWEEVAKKCKSPLEGPCGVMPSKYILKVQKKVKNVWQDEVSLALITAMGC